MSVTFTSGANSTPPDGTSIDTGSGNLSANGTQRVVIATDQPAFSNNVPANIAQMNGVTVTMGNGVSGTGVQRVTIASDSTGQVALAAGSATIGSLAANQSVNVAQMNGVAVTMGNGVAGTGVQRVAIASDNTAFPVNASLVGATSGGATTYSLVSAATANATNVKSSAGQVFAIYATNTNAAVRYVKFYNSASAPTAGAGTPVWRMAIPGSTAGGGGAIAVPQGLVFSSGIGFTIVTGAADSDSTAVAANEILLNIAYA